MGDVDHDDEALDTHVDDLSTEDTRAEWIATRVISSLKQKQDRWQRLLAVPEAEVLLKNFLGGDERALVFTVGGREELVVDNKFPNSKKKLVFFVKREHCLRWVEN